MRLCPSCEHQVHHPLKGTLNQFVHGGVCNYLSTYRIFYKDGKPHVPKEDLENMKNILEANGYEVNERVLHKNTG